MKRAATAIIAALLTACLITGCGNNGGGTASTESTASTASTQSAASTEESTPDENLSDETPSDNSASEGESQENSPEDTPSQPESSAEEITNKNYRELDAEYSVENGVIVVYQDGHYRGLELFGGGSGDAYVDSLNSLRSKLDSSIKMYSMIAPLAAQYYIPANYEDYTLDQQESINDSISSRLDSGITTIDLVEVLKQHTSEPIYCRTDHHWTPLGAFYAAQAFANAAGADFHDLSSFKAETINDFVGTMYAFSGDINIKNDPEDFTYYIPDNYDSIKTDFYDTDFTYDYTGSYFKQVGDPQSNAYLTFFGGDEQIVKMRTNVKNGKKLLVIKDSYGNALPSNLTNGFEEIYIIDMRYFRCNLVDFINQLGISDVLFTMCVFSSFGDNSYELPDLLTQASGQTITDNYDPNA